MTPPECAAAGSRRVGPPTPTTWRPSWTGAECSCGCYVNIRDVLAQATKEAEDRPLRAVIIVGDAFHDDPDGLDEAAISANRLRHASRCARGEGAHRVRAPLYLIVTKRTHFERNVRVSF